MNYCPLLLCLVVLCWQSVTATPINYLHPVETYFYGHKTQHSPGDNGIYYKENDDTADQVFPDDYGLYADDYYFPDDESYFLKDYGTKIVKPVETAAPDIPFKSNEYYDYFYRTPVGHISGDDVIAAVTFKHTPNVYYYEVAEAGPRHLKVIYYSGYHNRQQNSDLYYY